MDLISLGKSLLKSYDPESMNFLLWLNQFEHIVDLIHLRNNMKVEFLLNLMNPEAQSKIQQKVAPTNPSSFPYEVLISNLEELFGRYQGEWAANYRFLNRDQFTAESVQQYINALTRINRKVSLHLKNSLTIKVRFINGLKDIGTKRILLGTTNITLERAVTVANRLESNKLSNTRN
ncbi:hypothetical protein M0804_013244 [Polistes exclamans]|nr:hypothetical protein M0804_013244 [Polistes exclamans]